MSECTVYVSYGEEAPHSGVERFEVNAAGVSTEAPFTFTGAGSGSEFKYIEGARIVGSPEARFESSGQNSPGDVAVDSHGNIYVVGATHNNIETLAVYEYEPSGRFVRVFSGTQTPGLQGKTGEGGWGGFPTGVVVDPSSGQLLVSVANSRGGSQEAGAVDEFSVVTGEYLGQITATNPKQAGAHLLSPHAMTVNAQGDLYVVDNVTNGAREEQVHVVDEYGAASANKPSLRVGGVSGQTSASAVLSGAVDPDGHPLGSCQFQYVTEAAYRETIEPTQGHPEEAKFSSLSSGGEAPCSPAAAMIPADNEYHPVEAGISEHVVSGVTYRYRLVATTAGEGEAQSEALTFIVPAAPLVQSMSATGISSSSAALEAKIDPRGADTTYHFEYDTSPYTGAESHGVSVPVPDAGIGAGGLTGSALESVAQQIGGLAPATTYYFRVVATNEVEENGQITYGPETTVGEERSFTTPPEAAAGLPDNRAYELVTPANKGAAGDMFSEPTDLNGEYHNGHDVGYPSESGDQFLLHTTAAFGPFPASGENAYVFSRDPARDGWSYSSLSSPSLGVQGLFPVVFDPADLSRVGVEDRVGSVNSVAGGSYSSLVGPPGGPYANLHADSPVFSTGEHSKEETKIVGGARDLDRVVLESKNHALAPGAEGQDEGSNALYESTGGGECTLATTNCTLIDVKTNGELVSQCGAVLGLGTHPLGIPFEPESPFGDGEGGTFGKTHDAVSADGSKVIFTAPDPFAVGDGPECWGGKASPQVNPPQLYMRSGGETIEVSAPEADAPEAGGRYIAEYVGASEDGSRVFFVTEAWLTASHPQGHDWELYEYNTETRKLTRVSAGEAGSSGAVGGAGVFAVPVVSASGSAVYFIANGVLASNQGAGGGYATPGNCALTPDNGGSCNVYRYETATAAIVYVATVSDAADWGTTNGGEAAHGFGFDPREDWYTTPDGRYLLFLKGSQLYRYKAPSAGLPGGDLRCVSCAPSGAPSVANASSEFSRSALEIPDADPVSAMSANGEYVFFDSAQELVPQATSGTLDVYEWHDGTVSLISPGDDPTPSYFLGYSPTVTAGGETIEGANVFFGTHAQLVPADEDSSGNVYDARICTAAEPCLKPAAGETAQCEGGTCQTPPVLPVFQTPATLTVVRDGNLAPVPSTTTVKKATKKTTTTCRKGYVRKRVKKKSGCVKRSRLKQAKKTNRRAK